MCILEALACAVPIVSTDVGDISGMLDGGRLGALVPNGNIQEMTRVLQEAARKPASEAAAVTQEGRDLCVARFSTMAMARSYEEPYRG